MLRVFLIILTCVVACDSPRPTALSPPPARAGADSGADADAGAPADGSGGTDAAPSEEDSGSPGDDAGVSADAAPAEDAAARDAAVDAGERRDASPEDSGAATMVPDPELPGPFAADVVVETIEVGSTQNRMEVHCRVSEAAAGNSLPLVIIAHGFQLPTRQYEGYARHLAGFGYAACVPDYPAPLLRPNHVENAQALIGAIDWAASASPFAARVDTRRIAVMGHSLGGKLSILAASMDPRIRAVLGLDPVDAAMLCDATRCPPARDRLPLAIPIALLGETLDSTGRAACAPADSNYTVLYDRAGSPAIEVTFAGAGHMSFLDDPSTCGLPCSACRMATADHGDLITMARAYTVAFFERHLRGLLAYDDHLAGPLAMSRYVTPGRAAIRVK